MERQAYRGVILEPTVDNFQQRNDQVVIVGEDGRVEYSNSAEVVGIRESVERLGLVRERDKLLFQGENLVNDQLVISPWTANTHTHAFQPLGIPGELIVQGRPPTGWLPTTLQVGEHRAKQKPELAERMIRDQLRTYARRGVGGALVYATSSAESVRTVLKVAESIGMKVKVGYVAMDQGIDWIQPGLETTGDEAVRRTEELLEEFGPERIVVIDRFPIAVSSATRKQLAALALRYGAGFETHLDETQKERGIVDDIYGTPSNVRVLAQDNVFAPGMKVGLAHGIHTTPEEMEIIEKAIQRGCEVCIQACPQSNAALGSHWLEDGAYVPFPLRRWEAIGARIAFGTDWGAGSNLSIYEEILSERGRHPSTNRPDYLQLLHRGTIRGAEWLGFDLDQLVIREGQLANFAVTKMHGADSFYDHGVHRDKSKAVAARLIMAGRDPENIRATWVNGVDIHSKNR